MSFPVPENPPMAIIGLVRVLMIVENSSRNCFSNSRKQGTKVPIIVTSVITIDRINLNMIQDLV